MLLALTWEQRFDALAAVALDGGIDPMTVEAIRSRPYEGDVPAESPAANHMALPSAHAVPTVATPVSGIPPDGMAKKISPAAKRAYRACGECAGCRMADCNVCKYCLDKPKLGGSGTLRRRCILRVCERDTDGMAVAQGVDGTMTSSGGRAKRVKKVRCGECTGCVNNIDCNVCKYCLDKPKLGGSNTLRRMCVRRVCTNAISDLYAGGMASAEAEVADPDEPRHSAEDHGAVVLALPLATACPVDYVDVAEEERDDDEEEGEEYDDEYDDEYEGVVADAHVAPLCVETDPLLNE